MKNIVFGLSLLVATSIFAAEEAANSMEHVQKQIRSLDFKSLNSIDDIKTVWKTVAEGSELVSRDKAEVLGAMREMLAKVAGRLKEISSDPKFTKTPFLNVSVEGLPVSGMAPEDVKDPGVRKKYEEAIRLNN